MALLQKSVTRSITAVPPDVRRWLRPAASEPNILGLRPLTFSLGRILIGGHSPKSLNSLPAGQSLRRTSDGLAETHETFPAKLTLLYRLCAPDPRPVLQLPQTEVSATLRLCIHPVVGDANINQQRHIKHNRRLHFAFKNFCGPFSNACFGLD